MPDPTNKTPLWPLGHDKTGSDGTIEQPTDPRCPEMTQEDDHAITTGIRSNLRGWGFGEHTLQEICQEAKFRAVRKYNGKEARSTTVGSHTYSSAKAAQFAIFARTCAKNIAHERYRWQQRHATLPLVEDCCGVCAPPRIEDMGVADEIECVLNQLSRQDRELWQMWWIEGLSPTAIAKRAGASVKVIYARLRRMKLRVRKIFNSRQAAPVVPRQKRTETQPYHAARGP